MKRTVTVGTIDPVYKFASRQNLIGDGVNHDTPVENFDLRYRLTFGKRANGDHVLRVRFHYPAISEHGVQADHRVFKERRNRVSDRYRGKRVGIEDQAFRSPREEKAFHLVEKTSNQGFAHARVHRPRYLDYILETEDAWHLPLHEPLGERAPPARLHLPRSHSRLITTLPFQAHEEASSASCV